MRINYEACTPSRAWIPFGSHLTKNNMGVLKSTPNYKATFRWFALAGLIAGLITTAETIGFSAAAAQEEQYYKKYPFLHHFAAALTLIAGELALFYIPKLTHRFGPTAARRSASACRRLARVCYPHHPLIAESNNWDESLYDFDSGELGCDESDSLLNPNKSSWKHVSPFRSATPTKTALWFLIVVNLILGITALGMAAASEEGVGEFFKEAWTSLVESSLAHVFAVGELSVGLPILSGYVGRGFHKALRGCSLLCSGNRNPKSRVVFDSEKNVQEKGDLTVSDVTEPTDHWWSDDSSSHSFNN